MLAKQEWLHSQARALKALCLLVLLPLSLTGFAAEGPPKKKEFAKQVNVSVSRGFCEQPFTLKLTSPTKGASIRFTMDGSEPTSANGRDYAAPLSITNTTILRAATFKDSARISTITTHSYFFLDQVLHQPNDPRGLPSSWNGERALYGMDARVVDDPVYRDRMKDSLKSLPVVSLVCRRDDMFSPRGLYLNTTQRGEAWERPCSVEMILPDGVTAFQIDCGVRIQGNVNRIPNRSPKHSFRLLFKENYGAAKLHYKIFPDSPVDKFNTLVLRADYNNSWIHWDPQQRVRAQRTRDAWMKDSQRAMGWASAHNRYVHLFIDGLYWGVYDFTERPDATFAAAYLGGSRDDYDIVNEFDPKGGTLDAFKVFSSIHGLTQNSQYQKLQQQLDVTEYIDYLLLNYYAGNQDWGENKNWYTIRRRTPPGPFQYFVWDGEQIFHDLTDDTVSNPYETPFRLAEELKGNAEFRLAFADRVQRHFFNDGALTPAACIARWKKRAAEVDRAMIAESARWGGYRRSPPFTRDRDWIVEQKRLLLSYFPQRTGIVLEQLRAVGLYPKISAPVFDPRVGVAKNFTLSMSAAEAGKIYFTTNGVDPRVPFTGAIAADALVYADAITLPSPVVMKARVLKGSTWSALAEASFTNAPARR